MRSWTLALALAWTPGRCLAADPTPPTATASTDTGSLEATFRDGLFREEGHRDYPGAIEAYQAVVRAVDEQRRLAATAVFRLGECYRKLGRTNDAVAQYQRLLRDFTEEDTLTTLSRQNLVALGGTPPAPATPIGEPSTPAPFERERVASALARIQALENDPIQQALESTPTPKASLPPAFAQAQLQQDIVLLESQLKTLATQSQRDLFATIPTLFPTEGRGLSELRNQLVDIQRRLAEKEATFGPDHPERVAIERQLLSLERRMPQEVQDVLSALRTRLAALQLAQERLGALPEKPAAAASTALTSEETEEIRRIQSLVARSPDLINAARGNQAPPLFSAVAKGQLQVALYLLDHGVQPAAMHLNRSPLHVATAAGHKAIVELLIARGAPVDARTGPETTWPELGASVSEATPLHLAAIAGFTGIAEELLKRGADLNALDSQGTPLRHAVRYGRTDMVALLLSKGADPNTHAEGRFPPIAFSSPGTLDLLLARKAEVGLDQGYRLVRAAAEDPETPDLVRRLLTAGADPNVEPAASRGFKDALDPRNTTTPLLGAVEADHRAVAALLVEAKADPNRVSTTKGYGPLHWATQQLRLDWLAWLLEHGANPNLPTASGQTPLALLALERMIQEGTTTPSAPFEVRTVINRPGRSPTEGDRPESRNDADRWEAATLLLRHGAEPNAVLPRSGYPLPAHLAVWAGTNEFGELIRAQADLAAPNARGITPLMVAAANLNPHGVGALLAAGVPVNAADPAGHTALHYAAFAAQQSPDSAVPVLRRLLEAGADKGLTNRSGDTAAALIVGRRYYHAGQTLGLGVPVLATHPHGVLNGTAVRQPEVLAMLGVPETPEQLPGRAIPGAVLPPSPAPPGGTIPTLRDVPIVGRLFGGKAHVYGAVQRTLDLRPNQRLTLSEVFLESTPPPNANLKAVRLHRAPTGTNTVGETLTLDVEGLLRSNDRSKDLEIHPGDRIEVPERKL